MWDNKESNIQQILSPTKHHMCENSNMQLQLDRISAQWVFVYVCEREFAAESTELSQPSTRVHHDYAHIKETSQTLVRHVRLRADTQTRVAGLDMIFGARCEG